MNVFIKLLFVFSFLYLVWHFGRWYEARLIHRTLDSAYAQSYDTLFFTESEFVDPYPNLIADRFLKGRVLPGRCFTSEAQRDLLFYMR